MGEEVSQRHRSSGVQSSHVDVLTVVTVRLGTKATGPTALCVAVGFLLLLLAALLNLIVRDDMKQTDQQSLLHTVQPKDGSCQATSVYS